MLTSLLLGLARVDATVISARSVSFVDVAAAVAIAKDGDTVSVPAGTSTWTSTLTITKNIIVEGAGEGKTVIAENLNRAGSPPLVNVSLSHELPPPGYSFRLTGFTFRSANVSILASDHAFIVVKSIAPISPATYVLGCVSRVRLDHLTFDNLNGLSLLVDSCLGVADHLTQITATSAYTGYPVKVFHTRWTPKLFKGTAVTSLAANGFGSWADDTYWGTDKFWFFEDCSFTVGNNTNVADNEEGARVVFRHCTFNGGGGLASHGMEGRAFPGIRAQEVYNNYYNIDRILGQTRSGSILWYNNHLRATNDMGLPFHNYRRGQQYNNWGSASGDCRYDLNASLTPLYSGIVTAVGSNPMASFSDANQSNFNLINVNDGTTYAVIDKDQSANLLGGPALADSGWKYKHASIAAVSGKTLTLWYETANNCSPKWAVGDHYEVRKVVATLGQIGRGKMDLLYMVTSGAGAYNTYLWGTPSSGPKATSPMSGYPLEPAFSWNNYNESSKSYLGFFPGGDTGLLANRDYFNKAEITPTATVKVGYPAQDYTRGTTNFPTIGPSSNIQYTAYPYPHPLTTNLDPPSDLQVVSAH